MPIRKPAHKSTDAGCVKPTEGKPVSLKDQIEESHAKFDERIEALSAFYKAPACQPAAQVCITIASLCYASRFMIFTAHENPETMGALMEGHKALEDQVMQSAFKAIMAISDLTDEQRAKFSMDVQNLLTERQQVQDEVNRRLSRGERL